MHVSVEPVDPLETSHERVRERDVGLRDRPARPADQVEVTVRLGENGLLALTLTQARKPQEGKVIIRLSENPWQLRGWSILDGRGGGTGAAPLLLPLLASAIFSLRNRYAGWRRWHRGQRPLR